MPCIGKAIMALKNSEAVGGKELTKSRKVDGGVLLMAWEGARRS